MPTWKENLGDFFTLKHVYRVKMLENTLKEICDELTNYANQFNNISATKDNEKIFENNYITNEYSVSIDNYPSLDQPFKAKLSYQRFTLGTGFNLIIKYIKKFNINRSMEYVEVWEMEEFNEHEIIEKEYVLQLLIDRFILFDRRQSQI